MSPKLGERLSLGVVCPFGLLTVTFRLFEPTAKLGEAVSAPLRMLPVVKSVHFHSDELAVETTGANLLKVLQFLRDHTMYQARQLVDNVAVDEPKNALRFRVKYLLLSHDLCSRYSVTVRTDEVVPLPSTTGLFVGADWLEREVFDLMGISFTGHQDLRRILTDSGFQGHPLRKDFQIAT